MDVALTGETDYDFTIRDNSLCEFVTMSRWADTVTVQHPGAKVQVDGRSGTAADGGAPQDRLIVIPTLDMQPLVGSLERPEMGDGRVAIASPLLGPVEFIHFESLDIQLGDHNDQFTVVDTPSQVASTRIFGRGGNDQVTILHVNAPLLFEPGTGQDTLTVEVAHPLAAANASLANNLSCAGRDSRPWCCTMDGVIRIRSRGRSRRWA